MTDRHDEDRDMPDEVDGLRVWSIQAKWPYCAHASACQPWVRYVMRQQWVRFGR